MIFKSLYQWQPFTRAHSRKRGKVSLLTKVFVTITILSFCLPALALNIEEKLDDTVLEARAQDLFHSLRCVVCAGESIADSRVEIAKDLRAIIRDKVKQGASTQEILSFAAARYGDTILMQPPFKPTTYLLWFGPVILLLMGFIAILLIIRRNSSAT